MTEMTRKLENLVGSNLKKLNFIIRPSVRWLRTNRGGEYIGNEFQSWTESGGIIHEVANSYLPESSCAAERVRVSRKVPDMAPTMLMRTATSRFALWAEEVHTDSFSRNRLFTKSTRTNKTTYETIHDKRPHIKHVREFGSKV